MTQVVDNKYRVVRQIGAGGMGSVFEAEHTGVGRRVALKLMHPSLQDKDPSTLNRLQREARLAGSLDSPHIAQVYDTGIDGATGSPYLVMEYLVGEDLQSLLARSPILPPALALKITAQICRGLRKAHEAKVIHRDIKPANIFLAQKDEEIVVKVLDFGIAKLKADELATLDQAALTRTGSLIGSPLFMSPEQARGSKTIDQRADIWSVGVVMFNMLTGRTPYDDIDALGELILAICSTVSPSVRDYAPEVTRPVAQIVTRSLTILPEDRFQSVAELYEALLPHADGNHRIDPSMLVGLPERPKPTSTRPPQSSRLLGKSQRSGLEDDLHAPHSSARTQILEDSAPKVSPLPVGSSALPEASSRPPEKPASPAAFSVDGAAVDERRAAALGDPKLADSQAPTASTLTSARPRAVSEPPPPRSRAIWYACGAAAITFGGLSAYFLRTPSEPQTSDGDAAIIAIHPPVELLTATAPKILPEAPPIATPTATLLASASAAPAVSAAPSAEGKPKLSGPLRPLQPATAKTVDTNGFGDRK